MKSIGWNVYLGDELIDTVWFDADMTVDQVYDCLVNHDGYSSWIKVRR